jgi:hypothetical protein
MRVQSSIVVLTIVALLSSAAMNPSFAAPPRRPYDGTWSVVFVTLRGDCVQSYRYSVHIANGRLLNPEGGDFQVRGAVGSAGAIRVNLKRGDQWADGSGRLFHDAGRGRWRTSSGCIGEWTATRRDEE